MNDERPNPDELLERVKDEEKLRGASRGHLKIFFGYAAGVGKTYSMLLAARAAKTRGVDVVAGYVEPHVRPATAALLEGLECLPRLTVQYKGIALNEFDLDAALARKPQLILVDELAHTNAEGCRHAKRCQDVEELLKAGIDVYTTVNVQHIESLNDMIAAVTGVAVKERIPDSVFDTADQVELVDIEPADLMERLKAGKIYNEKQAERALGSFFDVKNLTALREIALRRCADRISLMSEKIRRGAADESYYTDEHILVCLSSSPTNPKIIRTGARMAAAFRGAFSALFVETSDFGSMSEENKHRLHENTQLAQRLGASVETVCDNDIPQQIAEFSRISGVSKVVIGRSGVRRKYFWSKPTLTEKLIDLAPNLDIYVIPDRDTPPYRKKSAPVISFSVSDTAKSLLLIAAATLAGRVFQARGFSESNIVMVYILAVLIISAVTSRRLYSLASSVLCVLAFNYFFTEPYYSLHAADPGYPVTFAVMFLCAMITSTFSVRLKDQSRQSSEAARRTKILLETNQVIQKGKDAAEISAIAAEQLVKLLGRCVIIYLPENGELGAPEAYAPDGMEAKPEEMSQNERAVAAWAFKNNKHAGAGTDTLGSAQCQYLAIRAGDAVYGVAGLCLRGEPLGAFENSVMLAILGECALALEREEALKERGKSLLLAKNEQLRANILRSISHDLRTPLGSISESAKTLLRGGDSISPEQHRRLCLDICDDAHWLINLAENLLSVTRIDEGEAKLALSSEVMKDVVEEALRHLNRGSAEHKIKLLPIDGAVMAKMDARLIMQVIINIVDNAIKYTQPGSHITLSVTLRGDSVLTEIADDGDGISDEEKKHIFEMFYTAKKDPSVIRRGMGLGLALSKSIIDAHGGTICVRDNVPKGSIFSFTLPKE